MCFWNYRSLFPWGNTFFTLVGPTIILGQFEPFFFPPVIFSRGPNLCGETSPLLGGFYPGKKGVWGYSRSFSLLHPLVFYTGFFFTVFSNFLPGFPIFGGYKLWEILGCLYLPRLCDTGGFPFPKVYHAFGIWAWFPIFHPSVKNPGSPWGFFLGGALLPFYNICLLGGRYIFLGTIFLVITPFFWGAP